MSTKSEKMSKKVKISRKICEKMVKTLFSVCEWYLLFCCHTTQGNPEKWRKTSLFLGCMEHYCKNSVIQPKKECCHYMQISKQKMWGKNTKICVYEWNQTSFSEKNTVFMGLVHMRKWKKHITNIKKVRFSYFLRRKSGCLKILMFSFFFVASRT